MRSRRKPPQKSRVSGRIREALWCRFCYSQAIPLLPKIKIPSNFKSRMISFTKVRGKVDGKDAPSNSCCGTYFNFS
ncbi:MAG: hypothetical protein ACFFD2_06870 [Promethearchaeota archaeon]